MAIKHTKNEYKEAIKNSGGILAVAAQKLGISRGAASLYVNKPGNEDLIQLLKEEKEQMMDMAENKLFKLIEQGDFQAIKFYLVSQAKARGYVDKVENNFIDQKKVENNQFKLEIIKPQEVQNAK